MARYVVLIKHDSLLTVFYQCLIVTSQYSQQDCSGIRRRQKAYTAVTFSGLPVVHKFGWIVQTHFWIEFEVIGAVTMKNAIYYDVASGSCLLGAGVSEEPSASSQSFRHIPKQRIGQQHTVLFFMDFLGSSKMSSPILAYDSQLNLKSCIEPN